MICGASKFVGRGVRKTAEVRSQRGTPRGKGAPKRHPLKGHPERESVGEPRQSRRSASPTRTTSRRTRPASGGGTSRGLPLAPDRLVPCAGARAACGAPCPLRFTTRRFFLAFRCFASPLSGGRARKEVETGAGRRARARKDRRERERRLETGRGRRGRAWGAGGRPGKGPKARPPAKGYEQRCTFSPGAQRGLETPPWATRRATRYAAHAHPAPGTRRPAPGARHAT